MRTVTIIVAVAGLVAGCADTVTTREVTTGSGVTVYQVLDGTITVIGPSDSTLAPAPVVPMPYPVPLSPAVG